jgi:purine-cytosine permease-like protein
MANPLLWFIIVLIIIEIAIGILFKYFRKFPSTKQTELSNKIREIKNDSLTLGGFVLASLSVLLAFNATTISSNFSQILIFSLMLFFVSYSIASYSQVRRIFWLIQKQCLRVGFLSLALGVVLFVGQFLNFDPEFNSILGAVLAIVIVVHINEFFDYMKFAHNIGDKD